MRDRAQPRPAAPAAAPAASANGKSGLELQPFSGSARKLGRQMKLGIDTAFNRVNDAGGVDAGLLNCSPRRGYEPSRTGEAMSSL